MFFRRKNIRPYDKASVIVGGKCFARSEQKLTDAGRPGPPEAYLSPFFVPSGDLDVPEGFSKNGDTLENKNRTTATHWLFTGYERLLHEPSTFSKLLVLNQNVRE